MSSNASKLPVSGQRNERLAQRPRIVTQFPSAAKDCHEGAKDRVRPGEPSRCCQFALFDALWLSPELALACGNPILACTMGTTVADASLVCASACMYLHRCENAPTVPAAWCNNIAKRVQRSRHE